MENPCRDLGEKLDELARATQGRAGVIFRLGEALRKLPRGSRKAQALKNAYYALCYGAGAHRARVGYQEAMRP